MLTHTNVDAVVSLSEYRANPVGAGHIACDFKNKVPEELYNLRGIRLVLVDYFWLPPSYYEDR
jgi:hypothetical protein